MSVPFWVAELADLFWAEVGTVEPYPRRLHRATARALELSVMFLPRLRLDAVREWLSRVGIPCPCDERDRPLRACLVARCGCGIVFIDGSDSEEEQRFSLAHELAHFLRHYWAPRRKAIQRLGDPITEVFDGFRPPTSAEEIGALLAEVPIGFHTHFLGRQDGSALSEAIAVIEAEADQLAFELLAPEAAVLESVAGCGDASQEGLIRMLQGVYGLPAAQASAYARSLFLGPAVDPILARLGLAE